MMHVQAGNTDLLYALSHSSLLSTKDLLHKGLMHTKTAYFLIKTYSTCDLLLWHIQQEYRLQ